VRRVLSAVALILLLGAPAHGQQATDDAPPVKISYGEEGLTLESADGRFGASVGLRAQFRWSYPLDDDPITADEFDDPDNAEFAIRRARVKFGGHAYSRTITYYTEYEILSNRLLDLRATLERWPAFQVRIGQWKPEYNRERRDSSGEQQFVDRSIVNRTFTIDRQPGMMVFGRLFPGERADSRYFAAVLSGAGLNNFDDEGTPMWFGRYQWNPLGRDLEFSQSDVTIRKSPAASIATAFLGNRSRYTRYSSSGGGELDGFPSDLAERYDIRQALVEAAYHFKGLSFQAEYHRKRIDDRVTTVRTSMDGAYAQAGYFFHQLWPSVPRPLELAFRAAYVDGDPSAIVRRELSVAGNWFFNRHRSKLTLDVSRLTTTDPTVDGGVWRARFQWDISI
jgi:phosphate-selective porin